jgi:GDSL-like Lipase/Acylhydrolase family
MSHLALLGDSIFDNAQYTSGGPDVVSQVRSLLPSGWRASLLAVDGSTTVNIPDQLQRLPRQSTHLVLSVGGNNALTEASRLGISFFGMTGEPTSRSLDSLADISDGFESQYRSAVVACLRPGLPLGICTIYNGCFPDKSYQRIASLALAIFNDVIIRIAIERGLPVFDLRQICTTPQDYANPIEPSSIGGEKIASAIGALVTGRFEQTDGTRILGAPRNLKTSDNPD